MGRIAVSMRPQAADAAEILGHHIRAERLKRGWTIEQAAQRIGVSARTLSGLEHGTGKATITSAFNVAAVLGVPLFQADKEELRRLRDLYRERNALLPRRTVVDTTEVDDDF